MLRINREIEQPRGVRYVTVVQDDDPPAAATPESWRRVRRITFLRELLEDPRLLMAGPMDFETMRVHHDGTRWLVTLEASDGGVRR